LTHSSIAMVMPVAWPFRYSSPEAATSTETGPNRNSWLFPAAFTLIGKKYSSTEKQRNSCVDPNVAGNSIAGKSKLIHALRLLFR